MDRWESVYPAISNALEGLYKVIYLESYRHTTRHLCLAVVELATDLYDLGCPRSGTGCSRRGIYHEIVHVQAVRRLIIMQLNHSTLKRGQQRLLIHRDKEADPSSETTTPSELPNDHDEMGRLEEVRSTIFQELTVS